MHLESYPQLIPLVILIPAIGAFINIFWGHRLSERVSSYIGIVASVLSFIISLLIFSSLSAAHGAGTVVNPVLFDGWIRMGDASGGFHVEIPWQFRVDTLTSVMLLVVTGVGSLIHIYSKGYMHGDPKFQRFFAYLNMFLMFMLVLVTANNYLMMFVGWEGVGLMSFLLIGFWWDKAEPLGWQNSNAARKAMIANRIGDFGVIMATILIFWTFGTMNYYSAGEVANVPYTAYAEGYITHDEAKEVAKGKTDLTTAIAAASEADAEHSEDGEHGDSHGDDGHGEDDGHGGHSQLPVDLIDNSQFEPRELGVFGQTEYLMSYEEGAPERMVSFGPFELDFGTVLFLIIIFLLLGATGKSAQIPLFVWLPDAMAGPTPVSALMHAATMVTAGIFMMVRSNVFLDHAPEARFIVAIVGATTALVAGYMAAGQWDIKRVLAYSTVSQLGFMLAAVGIGAYVAAMFHLVTHAVFKALLFLGSGSVIHGVEHGHHHVHDHHHGDDHHDDHHDDHGHHDDFDPQDMRNMGGLSTRMPVTFVTYMIGTFALSGLPFFAGFWSKDEILADAWHVGFTKGYLEGFIVLALLLGAAFFTAFYMWRQIQMVFFGEPRSEAAEHAPESVGSMTWPLIILAIGSIMIGFINVPKGAPFLGWFGIVDYEFKHWLESVIPSVTSGESLFFNWPLATLATVSAFAAIFLAHTIYSGDRAVRGGNVEEGGKDPLELNPATRRIWSFANARMYWDETYYRLFEGPFNRIGAFLANVVDWNFFHDYFHDKVIKRGYDAVGNLLAKPLDIGLIDGAVNGVGKLVSFVSGRLRGVQTGYVRTYAVALVFGVVAVVVLMLLPLIQNGL